MSTQEFTTLLLIAAATSFTPGPNATLSTALAANFNFGLSRSLYFIVAETLDATTVIFSLAVIAIVFVGKKMPTQARVST